MGVYPARPRHRIPYGALRRIMTREEWDGLWWACFARLRRLGYDPIVAHRTAREITIARYGQQPPKPPIWIRFGLSFVKRKISGLAPVEVKPMLQRVLIAAVYGIGALGAVLSAVLSDGKVDGQEWAALLSAFVVAAWGKFSSNTTVIAPGREVWSAEERAERLKP